MLLSEMSSSEILKVTAGSTIRILMCSCEGRGYKLRILYVCIESTRGPSLRVYILRYVCIHTSEWRTSFIVRMSP